MASGYDARLPMRHEWDRARGACECLVVSLPDLSSDSHLSGELRARDRRRLEEQLAILDPPIAPLLGAIPDLVPGRINGGYKLPPLDVILAAVGDQRFVKFRSLRVAGPGLTVFSRDDRGHPPLRREDQNTFWSRTV